MIFQRFNIGMDQMSCTFVVDDNGNKSTQMVRAPEIIINQQFLELIRSASQLDRPVKVELLIPVSIYNVFNKTWTQREDSYTFTNKAYGDENANDKQGV